MGREGGFSLCFCWPLPYICFSFSATAQGLLRSTGWVETSRSLAPGVPLVWGERAIASDAYALTGSCRRLGDGLERERSRGSTSERAWTRFRRRNEIPGGVEGRVMVRRECRVGETSSSVARERK